jgi:aspartate/methionine/tyrosine aminotransferase
VTFSRRLDWSVRPNPIADLLARKRSAGDAILDLTESNPTRAGIDYPATELLRAFQDAGMLRYDPQPFGLRSAREAVAGYYGRRVEPDRIVLTASTSEAYSYLFKLLADPGDEILVPRPSYPLFEFLARLESVRIVQYPLFYDHGWHVDLGALRSALTDSTRAVVIVNPNNPTGSYLKGHELGELAALAESRRIVLISDEVFADYAVTEDTGRVTTLAHLDRGLAFSLSGLSKTVGLPQMKLGWIVVSGSETKRKAALERLDLIADSYLSVGAPVQAAVRGLLAPKDAIQGQIRRRVRLNLDLLRQQGASDLRILDVEGGWYAIVQPPRIDTDEGWVLGLLEHENVLVQPGFFYDFDTGPYLVLSLLTETQVFAEGLRRLLAFVRSTHSHQR